MVGGLLSWSGRCGAVVAGRCACRKAAGGLVARVFGWSLVGVFAGLPVRVVAGCWWIAGGAWVIFWGGVKNGFAFGVGGSL